VAETGRHKTLFYVCVDRLKVILFISVGQNCSNRGEGCESIKEVTTPEGLFRTYERRKARLGSETQA